MNKQFQSYERNTTEWVTMGMPLGEWNSHGKSLV